MANTPVSDNDLEFKPWREVWQVHPDANRMPIASDHEQAMLERDIGASGLLEPVEFIIAGDYEPEDDAAGERIKLLDGRTRLDALDRLGWRFAHPTGRGALWRDPEGEISPLHCNFVHQSQVEYPFQRVVSRNVTRRHLSTQQKRAVIEELLKDMPEMSNRELGRITGSDGKTVGSVRQHLEALGKLIPQEETIGHDGRSRTTRPQRAPKTKDEGPPTVKIEKDRLIRLAATHHARDSGDLFNWPENGPERIAHVLVTDGRAQGATLAKVRMVAQAMITEVKRLEREARDEQRAASQGLATPGKVTARKLGDISEEQRTVIRAEHQAGKSVRDIAAAYGLFQDVVDRVLIAPPTQSAGKT